MEHSKMEEGNSIPEMQELLGSCSCPGENGEAHLEYPCKTKKIILMTKKTSPEKYGKDYPKEKQEADPISKCIGEYGRWQLRLTFLLSLFSFPCTFHIFSPTFTAATRDFWCERPAHLSTIPVELWRNYSRSENNCDILDRNWSDISISTIEEYYNFKENISYVPCTSWEWVTSPVATTVISDWNLVCGRSYLRTVSEAIFLAGVGIGGIVSGLISDRFGRKRTLMVSLVVQTVVGTTIFFSHNLEFYLALKFILGFSCVSIVNAGFVLSVELVDGKWRTVAGICNFLPLPVSYVIVSAVSMVLPEWRQLQLALTLPGILLICLWWVLPESPRWLLSMGKIDELKLILEKAAAENKRQLPSNIDKILMPQGEPNSGKKTDILDLFKSKMLKITIVTLFAWLTTTLTYYGIVLNVETFGGDLHLTSILSGLVELPSVALSILALLKLGRRYPISLTMILAGVACLVSIFLHDASLLWLKITFIMIGKFASGAMNAVLPMYTAELYPTLMRNLGVGAGQVAAGLALVSIPYIFDLDKYAAQLPMGVVAALGISGGLSVLLLPETANKSLIDDIVEDHERTSKPNVIPDNKLEDKMSVISK